MVAYGNSLCKRIGKKNRKEKNKEEANLVLFFGMIDRAVPG